MLQGKIAIHCPTPTLKHIYRIAEALKISHALFSIPYGQDPSANLPPGITTLIMEIKETQLVLPPWTGSVLDRMPTRRLALLFTREAGTEEIRQLTAGIEPGDLRIRTMPINPYLSLKDLFLELALNKTHERVEPSGEELTPAPYALNPREAIISGVTINFAERTISFGERKVSLTTTECEIIKALAAKKGEICSREYLLSEAYPPPIPNISAINTAIHRLRAKLEQGGIPDIIYTAHGQGYALRERSPQRNDPRPAPTA